VKLAASRRLYGPSADLLEALTIGRATMLGGPSTAKATEPSANLRIQGPLFAIQDDVHFIH
jgi:hypothetical protein